VTENADGPVSRLRDPRALRALAHPIRVSLVALLRLHGPLTATRAAELLGESSASASFHLRQLAKYGLVEEAGGGTGRERPWRATAMSTAWPEVADTPELALAAGMLESVIADRWFALLTRWLAQRSAEPATWQKAIPFGDSLLYVTAEELAELGEQELALMSRYVDRQSKPELRPDGARPVLYLHIAIPTDRTTPEES
jgi:predicted ArsR family transcriptional regulator